MNISLYDTLFIVLSAILSFIVTYVSLKLWIKKAKEIGFVGKDMNKPHHVEVAEGGGAWVSLSVSFGLLFFIALNIYFLNKITYGLEIMALALMLMLASFLGFLDDILGWKKGIHPIYRIMLMLPLAIPMVVIKAGYSTMVIPFIGKIDFGILYPLVLVPIGILGAANAFNMIAGYNGLEASMGIQLFFFTSIYAYMKELRPSFEATIIMLGAIIGFLIYNWYPAKIFPGNSFTYGVGAYYASIVVIGNFEKFGIILFSLYFIELLLFIRGLVNGVYKENYGKVLPDGTIDQPYEKIYSLTHLAIRIQKIIRGKATEKGVVITINVMQFIVGIISLFLVQLI
ncbi:MAG: glycosyl transferase family 4 [Staphylothermus sp.]|nr:glycosyl transferase family 4 [Staphylothermus sp.]